MKNTKIILQREDSSKLFISSRNSVRSWLKYFLTLIYSIMIFISLFSIEKFNNQDRIKWIFSLIWVLIIISIIKSLMIMNIKALYYSFQGIIVSLLMYGIAIGYGFFLTFEITSIKITDPAQFNKIFIYFTPAIMFRGVWKIIISWQERKTMPHFNKQLFSDGSTELLLSIPSLIASLSMDGIIQDIRNKGINGLTDSFYNSFIVYLIIIFIFMIVGLQLFKIYKWGWESSSPWLIGNTIFANAFITAVPLSFWYVYQYGIWINSYLSFLYVGVILILVMSLIYFSFLARDEARRSKLFINYAAIALSFIWGIWFIYGYISKDINSFMFSTTTATLATGIVVTIIYIKSPELKKIIFQSYKWTINIIIILVMILLIKYYVSIDILEIISSVINIFNLGLIATPIIFLSMTLMS